MLESLFAPQALKELEDRIAEKVLAKLKLDPTEQMVPQKGCFTAREAYAIRGISEATAGRKRWFAFYKLAPGERPTRNEVVAWLKKNEAELKAEYELWLKKQGARK